MPPPEAISAIIDLCLSAKWQSAHQVAAKLIQEGYTPMDIVGNILLRWLTPLVVVLNSNFNNNVLSLSFAFKQP